MSEAVDVAIVGAGPYGLSLAAHLRAAGASFRQFGLPMHLWQSSMPRGMFLKSQGFASNLSSPDDKHTLEAFCAATGRPYRSYGLPVPLDTFVAYGLWFQNELVPDLEQTLVTEVVPKDGHYEVSLADGSRVQAASVVVAAGVEHFARMPEQLAGLPEALWSHSSAHTDLGIFRGKSVVVLGAGQSALESAALLHENGADVQLVARKPKLAWNGEPLPLDRPWLQRLREPEAGLGSGWGTWFYSNHPGLFRHLPRGTRVTRARTALGPAGACWLPPRVQGKFPVLLSHNLTLAKPDGDAVRLGFDGPGGAVTELTADHVIAATGYRSDARRLTFLSDQLRPALRTIADTPVVDRSYRSAVAGLYFIGPVVAPTFGPVMRFVYGSDHAARTVSRELAATAGRRGRPAARATR
jgi:FAD-dependent urate hydroxylase